MRKSGINAACCRLSAVVSLVSILTLCSAGFSRAQTNDLVVQEDLGVTELKRQKTPPPDVHGAWCGSINDSRVGAAAISMSINQKGAKLSGSWTSDRAGSGTLKGKIVGHALTLTLQQEGDRCRAAVNGALVQSDEITGSYSIFGCRQSDGGTFDITSREC